MRELFQKVQNLIVSTKDIVGGEGKMENNWLCCFYFLF